jgi:hypothetical protein
MIPLFLVHSVSDLPVWIGNWEPKVRDLLNFNFPSDNFYPPGSALLLMPFIWLSPNFYIVVFIYYSLSVVLYFLICYEIKDTKLRLTALVALPLNPVLVWLCYSSQDTVFELFLLLLFIYSALKAKNHIFILSGFLLVQTRPAHWLTFLGVALFLSLKHRRTSRWLNQLRICFVSILLLPLTVLVNSLVYGTPALATESGMTLYFGNNKHTYLAHPKYDLDVFLSKENHMLLNPDFAVRSPDPGNSDQYTRMAIDSIQKNPKEITLAVMQKIESYVVGIQKIPNLSGEYYLSQDANSIVIGDERLNWTLIVPHFFYQIYRLFLLFFLFFTLGCLILVFPREKASYGVHQKIFVFLIPWLLGIIPGVLFFTETRYKIVLELLLVPFIMLVLQALFSPRKSHKEFGSN